MKKSLSFVLVLALVLGSFSTAFAATTATTTAATKAVMAKVAPDVEGTAYEAPVTVLTALGVVSGYEDGNYKPANNVTRAEMAKLIIAELGLEANAQASKSSFKDMSGYGWADGYVGYAASLGIILGYGDGNFGPGNNVTHDEALTMIVRALGYTKDCKEMNGTWPAIYVQKARVLGITDDVKTGGAVAANRGDVAVYLYNTLTCNMGYADDKGVFQEKKDKDGDPIKVATTLDAAESKEYKVITNSDANNAIVNIRGFVGAYAKVFTLTKGKNDGDIIAISDVKSDFISGEYKASDKILKAADGTEYTLDDVVTSVAGTSKDLEKGYAAKEFVNGRIASATQQTILNANATALDVDRKGRIVTIAADLSGKTVKGIYSVSIWNKISDEKVDADDIATIKSSKTLLGKKFIKDDNNDAIDLTSFELLGVKSLEDIKVDNVVYVYANSDDEITRVAVGTETAEGEITGIKEATASGDEEKVTIGGKTYLYASQKLSGNGLSNDFTPGDVDTEDEVKVYLDAYGYMYDYDSISGKADNYAVVLEHGGAAGGIGSKREIKLFLADGTDKVFNVDNDLFKGNDVVPGVTTDGTWDSSLTAGAIVKYGLDKDGMIESFEKIGYGDTAVKGYKMETKTSNAAIDITEQGYYNNTQIRPNAVIFSFEKKQSTSTYAERSDEDNYGVTTLEKVKKTKDVAATYVLDNNKIASMLLYDFSGGDAIYGVVTDTAKKKVGDADYMAKIIVDGVEKEYGLASKTQYERARGLTKFDGMGLQKIEFNASGEVKGLKDAWKDSAAKSGDTYATASAVISSTSKPTFNNNTFKVLSNDIKYSPVNKDKNDVDFITNASTVQVMNNAVVYSYDKGDFKVGNLGDLKSLNEKAEVWFYDTKDDNNHGLMNIVLINNTDNASTTPGSSTTITGLVTYVNNNNIAIDNVVYTFAANSILYNAAGNVCATGGSAINVLLDGGDVVESVVITNGVVTSLKIKTLSADSSAATIALITAFTGTGTQAQVTAARASYDALTAVAKVTVDNNATYNTAMLVLGENTLAADAFIALVTAFSAPDATQAQVTAARTAYTSLSTDAKAMGAVAGALTTLETEEAKLVGSTVDAQLAALPAKASVTLTDKTAVEAARTAYNGLTPAQAATLTPANVTKLTDAEGMIAAFERVEVAKTALTALAITNPTETTASIAKPGDHANGATYTLALGTLPTFTTGSVLDVDPVAITKDAAAFTFEITVTITDATEALATANKVFVVTVPNTVAPATVTVK